MLQTMQQKCNKTNTKTAKMLQKYPQKCVQKMQQKCRTIANSSKTTTAICTGWAGEAV